MVAYSGVQVVVFNPNFNNISVISWRRPFRGKINNCNKIKKITTPSEQF
jgi:hypothetical protein